MKPYKPGKEFLMELATISIICGAVYGVWGVMSIWVDGSPPYIEFGIVSLISILVVCITNFIIYVRGNKHE